jgi:hypothetical protein
MRSRGRRHRALFLIGDNSSHLDRIATDGRESSAMAAIVGFIVQPRPAWGSSQSGRPVVPEPLVSTRVVAASISHAVASTIALPHKEMGRGGAVVWLPR